MTVLSVDTSINSTLELGSFVSGSGNLLQGVGGRKVVLSAANSSVNPIVKVYSLISRPVESAVIENLVIDGGEFGSSRNVTGILLENVAHCLVRNVTIRNCEVGIHIRSYKGLWSECNTLKHIRMENVKKGIVFTTTGPCEHPKYPNDPLKKLPGNSAAFTTIEDVDITLANYSDAVGIQIGGTQIVNNPTPSDNDSDTTVQVSYTDLTTTDRCPALIVPYSSHIRAIVRLGSNGGCGLKVINGFLHYAQAHLTVIGHSNGSGVGMDLQEAYNRKKTADDANDYSYPVDIPNEFILYNQFSKIAVVSNNKVVVKSGFMLVTSNIPSQKRILRDPADLTVIDVDVKTIT